MNKEKMKSVPFGLSINVESLNLVTISNRMKMHGSLARLLGEKRGKKGHNGSVYESSLPSNITKQKGTNEDAL